MRRGRQLSRCGLGLIFLILTSAAAQAAVMPEARQIRTNKKMELKRKSGGFDTIARGYVTLANSSDLSVSGSGLDISIGTQAGNTCYVVFRVTASNVFFKFNGTGMSCSNFWNNDESSGNNNFQGLTINGEVWDEVNSITVPALLTIWPKREDRIRMVINSSAAGGQREWELDIDEGS